MHTTSSIKPDKAIFTRCPYSFIFEQFLAYPNGRPLYKT